MAISGFNGDNSSFGIRLFSSTNTIQCTFVGTNAAGTAHANGGNRGGIWVNGSSGHLIGTNGDNANDANERNLISGNSTGIAVIGNSNTIASNYIRTDITGSNDVGNTGIGVFVDGSNNVIGFDGSGIVAIEANLIRFNSSWRSSDMLSRQPYFW